MSTLIAREFGMWWKDSVETGKHKNLPFCSFETKHYVLCHLCKVNLR